MKLSKTIVSVLLVFSLMSSVLFGCNSQNSTENTESQTAPSEVPSSTSEEKTAEDIVILFTNDVHCAIDENIGYAGLAAYKKSVEKTHNYVTLVDCGDHTQGSYIGAVSKGQNLIDIMNYLGYSYATFGNHEFDFGLESLAAVVERANFEYLCCNFRYSGSNQTLQSIKPYSIADFGGTKVAFVGIATPLTQACTAPNRFIENGVNVVDFCNNCEIEEFFGIVQASVDAARQEGADYVIALSHIGNEYEQTDLAHYTSYALIEKTTGIDVLLDAHSHDEVTCKILQNKDGEDVLSCQTGTGLKNIGQLVISANGYLSLGYISDYGKKDEETVQYIETIRASYAEQLNQKVLDLPMDLKISDENGIRLVRSRETALGDLVADAYRTAGNADIGMCNGGGIRSELSAGIITFENIIAVNPYGNSLCVVEVTGAELADMLECFYRDVAAEYVKDGKAYGENGGFQQVSGVTFTIDTSIPTSVELDSDEMLISIGETRRVSDIKVLQNGEYVPIDPEKTYTIAGHNYMIKDGGNGMGVLLKDHNLLIDCGTADYQMLIDYFQSLGDDISQYAQPQGRITVK